MGVSANSRMFGMLSKGEGNMNRQNNNLAVDEFEDVHSEVEATAMPMWKSRELSSVLVEDVSRGPGVDKPFLYMTILLMAVGLIMVLSASFVSASYMTGEPLRFFIRQLIFAVSGIAIMLVISRISIRTISRFSTTILFVSLVLLVCVLLFGIRINGAYRWLGFGGENTSLSFQPSEITKLGLILAFSKMICKFGQKKMRTLRYGVLPFAAIIAVIAILLVRQPHISAAIIISATGVILMFAGGTKLRYFIAAALAGVLLVGAVIFPGVINAAREGDMDGVVASAESPDLNFSRFGHWGRRIDIWLNPDADPLGGGFQTRQSLNAVGSGGMLGQGLGQSRQKHQYLPEEHNDFIFAIIGEELGFVGSMLILGLFALLIIRGYWLALYAKDRYSALVAIGITSMLALQVFLNVAVVTNLIPATGIALPLFSYGGTALWIQLAMMGIVLSVSREIPVSKEEEIEDEELELEPDVKEPEYLL